MNWKGLWESQGKNLGKVVGKKVTSSVSGVENQDALLKNAEGDVSGVMILSQSKMYKKKRQAKEGQGKAGRG